MSLLAAQRLTPAPLALTLKAMEVHLTPELQAKLTHLAAEQGRPAETLVQEAVARLVSDDEWFLEEVDKGLAAAARGEFVEHEGVARSMRSVETQREPIM